MAASALDLVPMGTNAETLPASLTERRIRHFWEQTDKQGNERARYCSAHGGPRASETTAMLAVAVMVAV